MTMVEILDIPWFADKRRILRNIKTRAKGCGYPTHWLLRDPVKTTEKIYLRPKDLDKRKGVQVPVRRVLYHLAYRSLPMKRITMVCAEFAETEEEKERLRGSCINPAHMRIRGWEEEANEFIDEQIEKGWLYPDDARQYFGWENKHGIKLPEKFCDDLSVMTE
jgi:hypothetical protein